MPGSARHGKIFGEFQEFIARCQKNYNSALKFPNEFLVPSQQAEIALTMPAQRSWPILAKTLIGWAPDSFNSFTHRSRYFDKGAAVSIVRRCMQISIKYLILFLENCHHLSFWKKANKVILRFPEMVACENLSPNF